MCWISVSREARLDFCRPSTPNTVSALAPNARTHLIRDVIHVLSALRRCNSVHEGDLAEAAVGERDAYLPPIVHALPEAGCRRGGRRSGSGR